MEFLAYLNLFNMGRLFTVLFLSSCIAVSCSRSAKAVESICGCDTSKTKILVTSKDFNRLPEYDTGSFSKSDFYRLDSGINKMLWFRDIENPDTTKFTELWDAYSSANYHASHLDFVQYYKGRHDVEMAFQFGPNMDLWAYHIFVIKKIRCCYLITRSYFRHARFNYKAYSVVPQKKVDSLYKLLEEITTSPIAGSLSRGYAGYFVDNRNGKTFFIDFQNAMSKGANGEFRIIKEIDSLFTFVDKGLNWIVTYEL